MTPPGYAEHCVRAGVFMPQPISHTLRELVPRLNHALGLGTRQAQTHRVKTELEGLVNRGKIRLPNRFRRPGGKAYARRLLHRCPDTGCTAIVMCWGPGQETSLHDHAGLWCVECVLEGEIEVQSYRCTTQTDSRFQFTQQLAVRCGVGQAGSLIPPFEYHVLRNPQPDRVTLTLHVYENEMEHCNIFKPTGNGWYRPERLALAYDA